MIKNASFSGYHFHMNTSLQGDFQICISVPLMEDKKLLMLLKVEHFPKENKEKDLKILEIV